MAFNKLTLKEKLLAKVRFDGECWIWIGSRFRSGYGSIRIGGKKRRAHRVSYEVHHGEIPDGMVVRHSCDTPACIAPAHLSLGTQLENVGDIHERGRAVIRKGANATKTKLTEAKVLDIRHRFIPRDPQHGARALAREYGVTRQSISAIVDGRSWRHVA